MFQKIVLLSSHASVPALFFTWNSKFLTLQSTVCKTYLLYGLSICFYPEYKVTYVSLDVKKATINLYYILVNYQEEDTVSQFTFIFTL